MSRVGRSPVFFEKTVQVTITPKNEVVVKGAKHTMTVAMRPEIKAKIEDGKIILTPSGTEPRTRAFHGLYRALVQNAVTGVSKGWTRELELNGVGYRAAVSGTSREQVGQVAAKIRGFRPPEPYLGKGVKYTDEKIRRKAGKSAAK